MVQSIWRDVNTKINGNSPEISPVGFFPMAVANSSDSLMDRAKNTPRYLEYELVGSITCAGFTVKNSETLRFNSKFG